MKREIEYTGDNKFKLDENIYVLVKSFQTHLYNPRETRTHYELFCKEKGVYFFLSSRKELKVGDKFQVYSPE